MGQYFKIINVDKKQQMKPFDFDNFCKLMEFSYEGNTFISSLYKLLEKEWKGNRVYVTGDYDDDINTCDTDKSYFETYLQLEREFNTASLYHLSDEWKKLYKKNIDISSKEPYIRIYNTETKQFIDLTTLPVEWICKGGIDEKTGEFYKPEILSISPLPLLITFGNGAGGSYYSEDEYKMSLVGTWCKYTKGIVVSKEIIKEYEDSFEEFRPDFTENKKLMTHEEGLKQVENMTKEWNVKLDKYKNLKQQLEENNFIISNTDYSTYIAIQDQETKNITILNYNNYDEIIDIDIFLTKLTEVINEYDVQRRFDIMYFKNESVEELINKIKQYKFNLERLNRKIKKERNS